MSGNAVTTPLARPATGGNDRFLRLATQLDAVATGAVGALALVGAPLLDGLLGTPAAFLRPTGLFLVAYAAAIGVVGTRRAVSRPAVGAAVALNLLWVVASVALVARGPFALTPVGAGVVLAQAVAVAVFADLQLLGLRRARTA